MSEDQRLERRLLARFGEAIGDFGLIEPGDRILVGGSGGKDSWALLNLLRLTERRAPVRFDLLALNVDQGFPGFRADLIEDQLAREGYTYEMRSARINLTVKEKIQPGETFCSLCARLRRGALYKYADELGCDKIALGHQYVRARAFPVVCCACPGCKDPTLQRLRMKRLLRELERAHPGLKRSLLSALGWVDLGSLPIPTRRGARPGDRLPVLATAAGMALAGTLGPGDEAR